MLGGEVSVIPMAFEGDLFDVPLITQYPVKGQTFIN